MKEQLQVDSGRAKHARCAEMVQCLRAALLYSEKRVRDQVFLAMEELVSKRRSLLLSRLTREAAQQARRRGPSIGLEFLHWDIAGRAIANSMLQAGVFLTPDDRVVLPGLTAQAAAIGGLAKGYVDQTEAFLLEFLVRKLGDVSTRDHRALAHALFRQFDFEIPMDPFEDRIAVLLATLHHRVALGDSGVYTMLPTSELEAAGTLYESTESSPTAPSVH